MLWGLAECQWSSALDVQSRPGRESAGRMLKHALNPRREVEDPFMLRCAPHTTAATPTSAH